MRAPDERFAPGRAAMPNPTVRVRSWVQPLGFSSRGPIIAVGFSGTCPPGSEGTPVVHEMRAFVETAARRHLAESIVLDLRDLIYSWGDAILSLVLPLSPGDDHPRRRGAIVAQGATAEALEPLAREKDWLWARHGCRLVATVEEAVRFLKRSAESE